MALLAEFVPALERFAVEQRRPLGRLLRLGGRVTLAVVDVESVETLQMGRQPLLKISQVAGGGW